MPIPQNVNNRFYNLVVRVKAWFICNFVFYHDSVTTYRFLQADGWKLQPVSSTSKMLFTIVHRNEYSEFHRILPIIDVKELKAVLRMEMPEHAKHLISDVNQNSRNVTSYVFNDSALRNIAFFRALLPVSHVLAASALEQDCVIDVGDKFPYFISKFNGAVTSQKKTPIINSLSMFCLSSGVGDTSVKLTIEDHALPSRLVEGLLRLSVRDFVFFSFFSSLNSLLKFKHFFLASGFVAVLYMSLTSIVLHFQHKNISQQIEVLGPKLDLLLDKQQQLVGLEESVIEVNANAANNQRVSEVIQLFIDIKASGAIINDYQTGLNGVSIRGQVANASEFLLKLRTLKYVGSAEFKAPTVKIENFEEYSIQIVLKRADSHG